MVHRRACLLLPPLVAGAAEPWVRQAVAEADRQGNRVAGQRPRVRLGLQWVRNYGGMRDPSSGPGFHLFACLIGRLVSHRPASSRACLSHARSLSPIFGFRSTFVPNFWLQVHHVPRQ